MPKAQAYKVHYYATKRGTKGRHTIFEWVILESLEDLIEWMAYQHRCNNEMNVYEIERVDNPY